MSSLVVFFTTNMFDNTQLVFEIFKAAMIYVLDALSSYIIQLDITRALKLIYRKFLCSLLRIPNSFRYKVNCICTSDLVV
jgi:hypothetical protein